MPENKKTINFSLGLTKFGGRKWEQEIQSALAELNEHLTNGWDVAHAFPTSRAVSYRTACIVILRIAKNGLNVLAIETCRFYFTSQIRS